MNVNMWNIYFELRKKDQIEERSSQLIRSLSSCEKKAWKKFRYNLFRTSFRKLLINNRRVNYCCLLFFSSVYLPTLSNQNKEHHLPHHPFQMHANERKHFVPRFRWAHFNFLLKRKSSSPYPSFLKIPLQTGDIQQPKVLQGLTCINFLYR